MEIEKIIAYPGVAGGTFSALTDTAITTPAQGDVLYFDGADWVNLATSTAGTPLLAGGAGAAPYYSRTIKADDISSTTATTNVTNNLYVGGTLESNGDLTGDTIYASAVSTDTITAGTFVYADDISERTNGHGVEIDSVTLKDGRVTALTANIGTLAAALDAGGFAITNISDIETGGLDVSGLLTADSLTGYSGSGVAVEGVTMDSGDLTLTGNLTGIDRGSVIVVNPDHSGATDTRSGLGNYDDNRPFVTLQAAITAASSGDVIVLDIKSITENVTIASKTLTICSSIGTSTLDGTIAFSSTTGSVLYLFDILQLVGTNPAIAMSGTNATVIADRCNIGTIGGAVFTFTSSLQSMEFTNCNIVGTTAFAPLGTIYVRSGTALYSDVAGTGTLYLGVGSTVSGTITTTTILRQEGYAMDGRKPVSTADTASYTATVLDKYILGDDDTATGIVTITLPAVASAGNGHVLHVKKIGSTANVVVDGNASETIDGATTATLTTQYEALTLLCDGTSWHII